MNFFNSSFNKKLLTAMEYYWISDISKTYSELKRDFSSNFKKRLCFGIAQLKLFPD